MTSTNKFTVYNASAGSGKTYTLVKEYLLLLLKSNQADAYKNILAITFTNKAVAEMKSRVILTLHALSAKECPANYLGLMQDLAIETGLSEEKISDKSRVILKSILHNYASFDISTIDRFTHKVIRTFAKDLGIPVNFEVELNTLQVLQEAVDRLINRAGEDTELTRVLVDFTLSKTDDDKSWDISRDIFAFSRILLQENHQKYANSLKGKTLKDFRNFSEKIDGHIKRTEENIAELTAGFLSICSLEGLDCKDFKAGYVFKYFEKLQNHQFDVPFGAQWQLNIEEEKLYAAKLPNNKKEILDRYQPEIASLFFGTRAAIHRREYLKAIKSNITPLSLLSEVAAEIEHIKKDRSMVLISDFNPTISAQVQNQPAPFIYERLGERYRNYFIDEFQDTSEMQWENIIPLIDHALSSEPAYGNPAGLTLVGDAKQSIYRFRGGKAEQFIELYNHKNTFTIEQNVENLPFNYRSATNIVNFNNAFFEFISHKFRNPVYKELFANCTQLPKKGHPGYVHLSFLETQTAAEELEQHPVKVLEIIKDLEQKNVPKSDICVLTRTRKQSIAIANYLSGKGISIVSSESLLVANSPEVQFINAILEYSVNTGDKNVKWEILNYLASKLEPQAPHNLIISNLNKDETSFFRWLKEYGIDFRLSQLKELSLYEAAEYIIRSFTLIKRSNAFIQFYLDFIFEKTSQRSIGIPAFLKFWDLNKEKLSIIAPKTDNAVQIMTIHKSKGLEFPVVIYPFANTTIKDVSKEHLWLPLPEGIDDIPYSYFKASPKMLNWGETETAAYEELLDQTEFDAINILYVAFTRAAKQLYIISCLDLKKEMHNEEKVSGLLIGYLKHTNKWDGSLSYEFGENREQERIITPEDSSFHPEHYFSSPALNERVKLMTRNGELWSSFQEDAINTGILVHAILSEIDTLKDLPDAITNIKKTMVITAEREAELHKLISQVIMHPQLSAYFSEGTTIYRERDIISPTGDILRPDRLNFDGKKVTIIDYKTGQLQRNHGEQMAQYEEVLSQMEFEVSNKILIYINDEVTVSFV
ncbi:MAG: UvrD-helicase domain-containing protein [Gillisia sp.]